MTSLSNLGTIAVGSDTALGTGAITLTTSANNQVFRFASVGGPHVLANDISIVGAHTGNQFILEGFNELVFATPSGLQLTQNRTFNVLNAGATLTFAGPLTEDATARRLTKSGRGVLLLEGDNTFTERVIVNSIGGIVVLEGNNDSTGSASVGEFATLVLQEDGQLGSISALTVATGGTLQIDNSGTNLADRIPDVTVTLTAAKFEMIANAAGSSESIGQLTIGSDLDSTVHLVNTGVGVNTLTSFALSLGDREALAIRGTGAEIGVGGNELIFTANPVQVGGIMPRARIIDGSGLDFATATGGTPVVAAPFNNDINAGGNVKLTGAGGEVTILSGDVDVNALLLSNDVDITESIASILAINSGFIGVEGGDSEIEVSNLNFGTVATANARGTIVTNSSLTLDTVVNSTNTESIAKNGFGNLILEGANTYSGRTRIAQGGLVLRNNDALGVAGVGVNETIIANRARSYYLMERERLVMSGSPFPGQASSTTKQVPSAQPAETAPGVLVLLRSTAVVRTTSGSMRESNWYSLVSSAEAAPA